MLAAGSKDRSQAIDMLRIVLIFVVVVMVGGGLPVMRSDRQR